MECGYCYQSLPERGFCSKACRSAAVREKVEDEIATAKSQLERMKATENKRGARYLMTLMIFYRGCLKRSTKQQLLTLKEKVNEVYLDLMEHYSERVKDSTLPENRYLTFSRMIVSHNDRFEELIEWFGQ